MNNLKFIKKGLFVFGILFFLPSFSFVSATNNQSYQIFENNVLVEFKFEEVNNFKLEIPKNAKALEVNVNHSFEKNLLKIKSGKDVVIKYISDSFIEKTKRGYFFVAENQIKDSNVFVSLPEGANLLKNSLVFPKNYSVSSDGYKIILNWKNLDEKTILVSYNFYKDKNWFVYFIFSLLFFVLIWFYFLEKKKHKKYLKKIKKFQKAEKEKVKDIKEKIFTANLFGDEKKIIEILILKKKGLWTKEISKELEINKVTLSRKLRNLKQKDLIKKVHYGNADKIFLKK